jgi:hypothetical protein
VAAVPRERRYQQQLNLVRKAAGRVLREMPTRFFRDRIGPGSGHWWEGDLLEQVRGWDGQEASVPAPAIMGEIRRQSLEDIYALGIYLPWHQGIPPRFTQYVRELKKHGKTVQLASVLLWQGLTRDVESTAPEWIEQIDVVVPMATSLRSFQVRGHEVTEALADALAARLCVPCIDAFEREPAGEGTHQLSGYKARLGALLEQIRLKAVDVADLAEASGALIIDDVVTYGATFEACAQKLKSTYPQLRCWGAALAYTQTEERLRRALAEQ